MTSLETFIANNRGQGLLYPPNTDEGLRGQCVQLVEFYARDVIGRTLPLLPTAKDYYRNIDGYTLIPNSSDPNNVPQRGDIVIWNGARSGSGGAGHIAIALSAVPGSSTFTSFDSNWGGATAHEVTHNYNNIMGWLRPNQGGSMASPTFLTEVFQAALGRDPDSGAAAHYGQAQYADPQFIMNDVYNSNEARAHRTNVAAQGGQIESLTKQVQSLQAEVAQLKQANNTTALQAQLDDANKKLVDQAAQIEDLTKQLASIHNNQPVSGYSATELIIAGVRKFLRIDK